MSHSVFISSVSRRLGEPKTWSVKKNENTEAEEVEEEEDPSEYHPERQKLKNESQFMCQNNSKHAKHWTFTAVRKSLAARVAVWRFFTRRSWNSKGYIGLMRSVALNTIAGSLENRRCACSTCFSWFLVGLSPNPK